MKICNQTGKRSYSSVNQARAMCQRMSERIRVYACRHCRGMHVANAEKR